MMSHTQRANPHVEAALARLRSDDEANEIVAKATLENARRRNARNAELQNAQVQEERARLKASLRIKADRVMVDAILATGDNKKLQQHKLEQIEEAIRALDEKGH